MVDSFQAKTVKQQQKDCPIDKWPFVLLEMPLMTAMIEELQVEMEE